MNTFERYLNQSPSIFFKWKNKAGWPVVYVTQNIEEILGYKAEDFLTQKLFYDQIIHKEDLSKVIEEVLEGSKKKGREFQTRTLPPLQSKRRDHLGERHHPHIAR